MSDLLPSKDESQHERIATAVVQNVCELPDYNSPDDQPELVMCTVTELHNCVMRALEGFAGETAADPTAESYRLNMTGHQAKAITEFCGGEFDTELTVGYFEPAKDVETGEEMAAGLYVWLREYPEEGRVFLPIEPESSEKTSVPLCPQCKTELAFEGDVCGLCFPVAQP